MVFMACFFQDTMRATPFSWHGAKSLLKHPDSLLTCNRRKFVVLFLIADG